MDAPSLIIFLAQHYHLKLVYLFLILLEIYALLIHQIEIFELCCILAFISIIFYIISSYCTENVEKVGDSRSVIRIVIYCWFRVRNCFFNFAAIRSSESVKLMRDPSAVSDLLILLRGSLKLIIRIVCLFITAFGKGSNHHMLY